MAFFAGNRATQLRALVVFAVAATAFLLGPSSASAEADITIAQRREANRIQDAIGDAERLSRRDEFGKAAELVKTAQDDLQKLVNEGDEDVARLVRNHYKRLQRLHGRLALEGFELPALRLPGEEPTVPEGGGVSFVTAVAPILVGKCGRCHVGRMSGGVSLANFDIIMEGPTEGKIIFGGDADGSRLIEVIEEGDMPRGGGQVTEEELATLKTWIKEGARFDGEDRDANLSTLLPEGAAEAMPTAEIVTATGKETVSFANDIAPVLVANCRGCHIDAQNVRGGLNMNNFRQLIRGGDSGSMIVQGKPDESLLIGKLAGTAGGQRMPSGRPPLDEETMDKIKKWIEEGATFDGGDPNLVMATVASIAKASRASHEELSKERLDLANENWDLAMPGISPKQVEVGNFVVLGSLDEAALQELGDRAKEVEETVARLFRANSREPLIKGRLSLFAFRGRYDYTEFGQMVERRQLPDDWKGHWNYTIIDAYGALLMPRNEEDYSLDALLAQQIGGTYVASLGTDVPRWFAEGAGRVAALRADREDPRVVKWQQDVSRVLSGMQKPDDFIKGALSPEDSYIASFSFVEFLMSDSRRFPRLLAALKKGDAFAEAFRANYGGTPTEVATVWIRRAASGR